jgi:hypothetical protein
VVNWYFCSRFGMLHQEKSGNPDLDPWIGHWHWTWAKVSLQLAKDENIWFDIVFILKKFTTFGQSADCFWQQLVEFGENSGHNIDPGTVLQHRRFNPKTFISWSVTAPGQKLEKYGLSKYCNGPICQRISIMFHNGRRPNSKENKYFTSRVFEVARCWLILPFQKWTNERVFEKSVLSRQNWTLKHFFRALGCLLNTPHI